MTHKNGMSRFVAFAIYGSSQLFCVVWQVVLLASFAVITYAYLRIEDVAVSQNVTQPEVITYAYLRIEESARQNLLEDWKVITYAYLRIEDACRSTKCCNIGVITYAYLRIEETWVKPGPLP